MTHESTASITRERKRRNKKKKVGERKIEILFWFSSFILSFFFSFYESIFILFRCSFSTYVYLACGLLLSFLFFSFFFFFFYFFEKGLVVCFNKDGDFVLAQLIHFISFFYLMKLYLFHLNVVSPDGFVLHVDYYFLSSCFFFFLFFFFFFLRNICWIVLICYMQSYFFFW